MTGPTARAEKAKDWFWITTGIAVFVNTVLVQILDLDFLGHGWWLVPRYALSIVGISAGAVWAWEAFHRRRKTQRS